MLSDKREIRSGLGPPSGCREAIGRPVAHQQKILSGVSRWSAGTGKTCLRDFGAFNGADRNTSLGFTNQIPYFLSASAVRGASTVLLRQTGFGGFTNMNDVRNRYILLLLVVVATCLLMYLIGVFYQKFLNSPYDLVALIFIVAFYAATLYFHLQRPGGQN